MCSQGRRYSISISPVPERTPWNCQRRVPPFPGGPVAGSNVLLTNAHAGSGFTLRSQRKPVVGFSARDISTTSPTASVTWRPLWLLSTCIILGCRASTGHQRPNPINKHPIVLYMVEAFTLASPPALVQSIVTPHSSMRKCPAAIIVAQTSPGCQKAGSAKFPFSETCGSCVDGAGMKRQESEEPVSRVAHTMSFTHAPISKGD